MTNQATTPVPLPTCPCWFWARAAASSCCRACAVCEGGGQAHHGMPVPRPCTARDSASCRLRHLAPIRHLELGRRLLRLLLQIVGTAKGGRGAGVGCWGHVWRSRRACQTDEAQPRPVLGKALHCPGPTHGLHDPPPHGPGRTWRGAAPPLRPPRPSASGTGPLPPVRPAAPPPPFPPRCKEGRGSVERRWSSVKIGKVVRWTCHGGGCGSCAAPPLHTLRRVQTHPCSSSPAAWARASAASRR